MEYEDDGNCVADEDDDHDDHGSDSSPQEEQFDDAVDDEQLVTQLNTLADIEDANAGETISAEACAAYIQVTCEADAAWDAVRLRPKGNAKGIAKGGKKSTYTAGKYGVKKGHFLKGKGKYGVRFGKGLSLEERKKKLADLKKRTKRSACGQTGHWAGDLACPKGSIRPEGHMSTLDVPIPDGNR